LSGWTEFTAFEEKLTGDILEAGREGIIDGLYPFAEGDTTGYMVLLERGVGVFTYLAPGAIVLMTVATLFLAATLMRYSSSFGAEILPEEKSFACFRFNDQLLWVLTGGLILLAGPFPDWVKRIGANGALVMGSLFLLRGTAIWVYYLGRRITSPMMKACIVLFFFILFPPLAAGLALVLGFADIWIDVRKIGQEKGVV
jgi:uncharacterized protein YybS (DUF2232 family)